MLTNKMMCMRLYVLCGIAFIISFASAPLLLAGDELDMKIKKMSNEYGQGKLTVEQFEEQSLQLQKTYKSEREKGRIYMHIAYVLEARTKQNQSDRVIKYAKLAVTHPLEVLEKVRTYRILGDGYAHKYLNAVGAAQEEKRKLVVTTYLQGLQVVLDNLTTTEKLPFPGISKGELPGDQHRKEVEESDRVELQNHLIDARDAFIRDLVDTYAYATDSNLPDKNVLEQLSKEILSPKHEDVRKQVMDKAAKRTEEWQRHEAQSHMRVSSDNVHIIQGRRKHATPKVQETPQ
jgi:hypothetical protein